MLLGAIATSLAHADVIKSVVEETDSPSATQVIEHRRDGMLRLREVRRASKEGGPMDSVLLFLYYGGKMRASYARYPKGSIFPSSISMKNAEDVEVQVQLENEFGKATAITLKAKDGAEIIILEPSGVRLASDAELISFKKATE